MNPEPKATKWPRALQVRRVRNHGRCGFILDTGVQCLKRAEWCGPHHGDPEGAGETVVTLACQRHAEIVFRYSEEFREMRSNPLAYAGKKVR